MVMGILVIMINNDNGNYDDNNNNNNWNNHVPKSVETWQKERQSYYGIKKYKKDRTIPKKYTENYNPC